MQQIKAAATASKPPVAPHLPTPSAMTMTRAKPVTQHQSVLARPSPASQPAAPATTATPAPGESAASQGNGKSFIGVPPHDTVGEKAESEYSELQSSKGQVVSAVPGTAEQAVRPLDSLLAKGPEGSEEKGGQLGDENPSAGAAATEKRAVSHPGKVSQALHNSPSRAEGSGPSTSKPAEDSAKPDSGFRAQEKSSGKLETKTSRDKRSEMGKSGSKGKRHRSRTRSRSRSPRQ